MAGKRLDCGDFFPGCQEVFHGKDNDEILQKAGKHCAEAHGVTAMPPEVVQKVVAGIKDE